MFRKLIIVLISLSVLLAVSCESKPSGDFDTVVSKSPDAFSSGDFKDVSIEKPDAEIVLSQSDVTITGKGVYRVTGSSDGAAININDESKSGNVYLVLDNVTMKNSGPCIRVSSCEKVIIWCVGDNSLDSTDENAEKSGAIYSKDDLTINGSGNLAILSATDGIVCKNDLKITGGHVTVTAAKNGIDANDSVRIGGGETSIGAGQDAVHLENAAGTSYFYMEDGALSAVAGNDGIDVKNGGDGFTGYVKLVGGSMNIISGGGADVPAPKDASQKGIKCDGAVLIGDISLKINSSDDAISSAESIFVTAGITDLASNDEGIRANLYITVSGGELSVSKSVDAFKADSVIINGGTVLALGTAGSAVTFSFGSQCAALVQIAGNAGDKVSVDDGSGFAVSAGGPFSCVVYSSPDLVSGKSYTVTAGSNTETAVFTPGIYYEGK